MKKLFRYNAYQKTPKAGHTSLRIHALMLFAFVIFSIIIFRLFQLQVMQHDEYRQTARDQHFGAIELPAKRGDIYARDTRSGKLAKLATNTTLDLVYVDPNPDPKNPIDPQEIASKLTPLIFTEEEYEACVEHPSDCYYPIKREKGPEIITDADTIWDIESGAVKEITVDREEETELKSYGTMLDEISNDILKKLSKKEVDFVPLKWDADPALMADVVNERLPGIFVDKDRLLIHADPTLIPKGELTRVATVLSEYLGEAASKLESSLTRKQVRYVFLKNRLDPKTSQKISELDLKGLVLLPEHWRFYPENNLASQVVGFINRENSGQYGVEGYFNTELEGKAGSILAESDPFGRQITVGNAEIVNAVDGDSIVLTIDRVVQKEVEKILQEQVEKFRADSGQVIIMDPFSGAIVSMANYPGFDPNAFADSYELKKLEREEMKDLSKTIPVFKKDETGKYVDIEEGDMENDSIDKFIYTNRFGPGVFKNKVVSEFYEPGSVFKPIVMSIALDAKEVSPETTYNDDGPIKIDEFEIKNSTNNYYGVTTMTEVLEKSLNTGMSRVAQKLGKKLMYDYIKDFGFGEYTNIELEGESKGKVDYYTRWSTAQMLTTSFGQGIVVTPLQMITAWATLANGGKLMQPYIVDSVIRGGKVTKTEPEVIHRVLSEDTSSIITSMLISVVRSTGTRYANIPGHLVAGKTGTAQIAGKNGRYETGDGSTITSFIGYFPALKPRFVVLVKLDRARIGENTWGETTAAPTFRRIAEFLIDYYNIEPTE